MILGTPAPSTGQMNTPVLQFDPSSAAERQGEPGHGGEAGVLQQWAEGEPEIRRGVSSPFKK